MPKISERQKEAVRAAILEAAGNVFRDKGYEAASMKEIVERSGRSFGGVYLYYANKEEVFLDLLRRRYEDMASDFAPERPAGAWEAFERFLRKQERRVQEAEGGLAPCLYEYMIVGRRDPVRRRLIEERQQAVCGSLMALVQDGVERGEFRPSRPVDVFANWLVSYLDGAFLESILAGPDKIGVAEQFELLMSVCKTILMPRSPEGAE